jgi:hypothetical protein
MSIFETCDDVISVVEKTKDAQLQAPEINADCPKPEPNFHPSPALALSQVPVDPI